MKGKKLAVDLKNFYLTSRSTLIFARKAYKILKNYFLKRYPQNIDWVLTGGCNSKCFFCEVPHSSKKDLSKKNIFENIDHAIQEMKIRNIYFAGGEVFLRKDIWDIFLYAKNKGLNISLTSNGLLLKKFNHDQLEILDKTISTFRISLDSTDKKQYDDIRGVPGAYEKVLAGIDILTKLPHIQVIITAVIMKSNFSEIPKLCQLAKKHDVRILEFQPLSPDTIFTGTNVNEGKRDMLFQTESELIDFKTKICEGIEISKALGLSTDLPLFYHYAPEYFRSYFSGANNKEIYQNRVVSLFKCQRIKGSITVDYEGSIKPCILLPSVGHVNDITLKNQYNKLAGFRQNMNEGNFHELCSHCFCNPGEGILLSALLAPIKNRKLLISLLRNRFF